MNPSRDGNLQKFEVSLLLCLDYPFFITGGPRAYGVLQIVFRKCMNYNLDLSSRYFEPTHV
jgi:hypothetical protein